MFQSGGATTLKGAQVAGSQVTLKASDLTIESLQDKASFKGKQDNAQGEVTIGYGASGSASISRSKISADFAGVNEQSGIFAHDQGYQIDVAGHTDLTGAIITSSADAEQKGLNRLTTGTLDARDINNHSKVRATSVGIGGDGNPMGVFGGSSSGLTASFGFGSFNSNESSVTHSGINTANITITRPEAQQALTGKTVQDTIAGIHTSLTSDEAQAIRGLENTFDKDEVQKEIDLQREVSQQFSKNTQEASGELKKRMARNDADFKAGLISEKERDERNAQLRNYDWLLSTISAGLATPSNGLAGSLIAAASPTIAREIGQQFKQAGKEGSAGHIFAHAALGALVTGATGNSVAGGALAGASAEAIAPITAKLLFDKDVTQLTPDEKQTVSSIASLTGAGLAGAVGGDGRSLVSGSVTGRTSVENNYLSNSQQVQMEKEVSECLSFVCRVGTTVKWTAISLGQDGSFASGMIASVPASMYEAVQGLVQMGLSPIETLTALYSLVTSDDLGGIVAESLKQSFSERIDRLVTEYERAGASGSFNAGVEAGKLFVDVAPWITGGVGIARNAVVLTEKIAAKAIAKKAASAVEAGKKDISGPKPAHSYVRLTEQQRLDKNNELFDNFTGGSNRIKNTQITIDGQIYKANKDLSKNAAVFDNVSQGKVIEYFKDLTGEAFLPSPKEMGAPDIYGNSGIRYTVEKNGMSYSLRSGSRSNDLTGAKWTVEINGIPRTEINGRILKRDSIEIKFR